MVIACVNSKTRLETSNMDEIAYLDVKMVDFNISLESGDQTLSARAEPMTDVLNAKDVVKMDTMQAPVDQG